MPVGMDPAMMTPEMLREMTPEQRREMMMMDPRDMGIPEGGRPVPGRQPTRASLRGEPEEPTKVTGKVKLLTHDLTAQPNEIYRYRVRAFVLNPLFRQQQIAEDLRQQYMNKLALPTPWSAWSEPVTVDKRRWFFVVGSNAPGVATVEVWYVFNGQWLKEEYNVAPGDPIGDTVFVQSGGLEGRIDLNLGLVAVDVDSDAPVTQGIDTTRTTQLVYLDDAGGGLHRRTANNDRRNEVRTRLLVEYQQSRGMAALGQ
jgi:hypothetical protein